MRHRGWVVTFALIALVAACATSTSVPATSATPSPTASGGSPVAASTRPSAAASVDPATAAVRAFVAFASDPKAAYQATFTGDDRHSTAILTISKGILQVGGANVLVRATFTYPNGDRYVVEHRAVGGKARIRFGSSAWQRLAGFVAADSMAAFPAVRAATDATYLGPTTVDGKTLYRIQVQSAIVNPVMIPASNLTDVEVTSPVLVVLVDGRGRPVRGTATIGGRGRVSGQLQEIAIDLDLTFVQVGQPVSIAAP